MAAIWGTIVCVMCVSDVWKAKRLKQARDWPVVEGSVVHVQEVRGQSAVEITLSYNYKVQERRYGGHQSLTFRKDEDAARFKKLCEEPTVQIHYRPDKPDVSFVVPRRENIIAAGVSPSKFLRLNANHP